jgi:cell division protein FtsZ
VIINVTGGPDLSLVEVSEASSIVQEAADEEANIIFGAVVDPALKGKVKITVIATGFGAQTSTTRLPVAPNATPVDLTPYADAVRARAAEPAAAAPAPAAAPATMPIAVGSSIAPIATGRRPALELPFAAAASASAASNALEPDLDLHSPFDVPAFLRRQEG